MSHTPKARQAFQDRLAAIAVTAIANCRIVLRQTVRSAFPVTAQHALTSIYVNDLPPRLWGNRVSVALGFRGRASAQISFMPSANRYSLSTRRGRPIAAGSRRRAESGRPGENTASRHTMANAAFRVR